MMKENIIGRLENATLAGAPVVAFVTFVKTAKPRIDDAIRNAKVADRTAGQSVKAMIGGAINDNKGYARRSTQRQLLFRQFLSGGHKPTVADLVSGSG